MAIFGYISFFCLYKFFKNLAPRILQVHTYLFLTIPNRSFQFHVEYRPDSSPSVIYSGVSIYTNFGYLSVGKYYAQFTFGEMCPFSTLLPNMVILTLILILLKNDIVWSILFIYLRF